MRTGSRTLLRYAAGGLCTWSIIVVAAHAADGAPPVGAAQEQPESDAPWNAAEKAKPRNAHGGEVFAQVCAACHEHGVAHAPSVYVLQILSPSTIYRALTTGPMRVQARDLTDSDKRAVAEFLAGPADAADAHLEPPVCQGEAAQFDFSRPPPFPGWGLTPANTRYVASAAAGVDAGNVGKLHLKWVLGFDGAVRSRSQPSLGGGAVFVGSQDGRVYALDRETGCARWQFQATAEVRTAITLSSWEAGNTAAKPLLYFGDIVGHVYAVDARSGALQWRQHVDDHPSTTVTGSPVLYKGALYVPVGSVEEGTVNEKYPCCTFRGAVAAYDALTGVERWRTFLVDKPHVTGMRAGGVKSYGPSGVAVWNTPAIDAQRSVLYVGTGDNYSSPATPLSDSIVAMDLAGGKIKWHYQATARDAWNGGCAIEGTTTCPKENGPDADIGAAIMLATGSDAQQYVIAAQKSGWVYAVAPDTGKLVWKNKVGRGGILAGVYFGMATRGDNVYVPVNDAFDGRRYEEAARPGLYSLELKTGRLLWSSPTGDEVCKGRGGACAPGIAAPITVTDDLILSGASDGRLRFYDIHSGRVLWQFDTTARFTTVGGGAAHGGSLGGGAGPLVYDGTVIVDSGYDYAGRMPGNVMLVFGTH